jgi:hypothetical protein
MRNRGNVLVLSETNQDFDIRKRFQMEIKSFKKKKNVLLGPCHDRTVEVDTGMGMVSKIGINYSTASSISKSQCMVLETKT